MRITCGPGWRGPGQALNNAASRWFDYTPLEERNRRLHVARRRVGAATPNRGTLARAVTDRSRQVHALVSWRDYQVAIAGHGRANGRSGIENGSDERHCAAAARVAREWHRRLVYFAIAHDYAGV